MYVIVYVVINYFGVFAVVIESWVIWCHTGEDSLCEVRTTAYYVLSLTVFEMMMMMMMESPVDPTDE